MLASTLTACLVGTSAERVRVEVRLGEGLPAIDVVGLAERAVRESRVRVKAALASISFSLPPRHLVINLAPGDLRKSGTGLDLAIALAILAACEVVDNHALDNVTLLGELALNGELRSVRGVLPCLRATATAGTESAKAIVPRANAHEAALLKSHGVVCASSLGDVVAALYGETTLPSAIDVAQRLSASESHSTVSEASRSNSTLDISSVRGQHAARRALEIAAAGNHHTLLIGSPGSGKTMLARALPTLLPHPTHDEVVDIATIASAAGVASPQTCVGARPFRSPHHTVSAAALLGGGEPIRAGEVTLAHGGVLFLDELPEFRRDAVESLRTTIEHGEVTVCRSHRRVTMPARALVVAAMNPCPCGYAGDPTRVCRCSAGQRLRYQHRVSGPLLDRFDLHVAVHRVPADVLRRAGPGDSSNDVRSRVVAARNRLATHPAEPTIDALSTFASHGAMMLLERGVEQLGLSARGFVKTLRVSRTIAALDDDTTVQRAHVVEALGYRAFDQRDSSNGSSLSHRSAAHHFARQPQPHQPQETQ